MSIDRVFRFFTLTIEVTYCNIGRAATISLRSVSHKAQAFLKITNHFRCPCFLAQGTVQFAGVVL